MARKPTRAERRWRHFSWQLAAAPTERDRMWAAGQYLRAVLADAKNQDEAERVAARIAQELQEAAHAVQTRERR